MKGLKLEMAHTPKGKSIYLACVVKPASTQYIIIKIYKQILTGYLLIFSILSKYVNAFLVFSILVSIYSCLC